VAQPPWGFASPRFDRACWISPGHAMIKLYVIQIEQMAAEIGINDTKGASQIPRLIDSIFVPMGI
jgi:hypothetical protein